MQPTSVSISFAEGNVNEIQGISGIRISNEWIITHGMLLRSKIIHDTKLLDIVSTMVPDKLTHLSSSSSSSSSDQTHFRVRVKTRPWLTSTPKNISDTIDKTLEEVDGSVIIMWRCPLLTDTLENLLFAWSFGEDARKINKALISVYLLVRIHHHNETNLINQCSHEAILQMLSYFIDHAIYSEKPRRGALVEIESTPFGNPIFMNSISQGIVSNVLGTNNCVMLTDANAVSGCEGGPVYLMQQENRMICGMVIAPLSWCHTERVYYTFVACIIPCLRRLLRKWENIKTINEIVEQKLTDLLDKSVVLVRCGTEWGSGILLDRDTGTILTCSHVVNEAPDRQIKIILHRNTIDDNPTTLNTWAKLVYRTPRGQPYDVAVLKVDSVEIDSAWKTLRICDCNAQRGELVVSAGFPFFLSPFPTITRGNISNVSTCMLQTTCCVQSGASGGPIVRFDTGELLGMTVCNVISSNTLYPRLNMAIPATILKGPINEYIQTGNTRVLERLASDDIYVLQAWNFHLPSKI